MHSSHFKILNDALRALVTSVVICVTSVTTYAAENDTLSPGSTPREAVLNWLDALKSDREILDIIQSPLVAISPYCPEEKWDTYAEIMDGLRQRIVSHELAKDDGKLIHINRFAGLVLRLSKPSEPLENVVVGVAAIKTDEGWKVPVGIQHFDNVLYGFDKKLRQQQASVTHQLADIKREVSIDNEAQIASEMLSLIQEKRESMELNDLEPEVLALRFVYPDASLSEMERLSFLAIPDDASALDLEYALQLAQSINENTSADQQPTNAEIMAEALNVRVDGKLIAPRDVRRARVNILNEREKNEANNAETIRPIDEMPWPADGLGNRQFRKPSAMAVMLPKTTRAKFGDLPEPHIEIVEKTVSEDGNEMAISFGLFDLAVPGRFDVLPIYLRKISGQWKVTLPNSQIFESTNMSEDIYRVIQSPDDELIEWYYDNYLNHLDKFANNVVALADQSGEIQNFETPREAVQAYIDAVADRDLLRCLRLVTDRSKAFSRDLEDVLDAIKKSYEILDAENHEIHVAGSKYTVKTHDTAAMLWVTRIPKFAPNKIVVDAIITENAKDGKGWKISPGIHEVFPISERPNIEDRKTLALDKKQAEVLAEIDQLRVAQESDIRDACILDLFSDSAKVDKINSSSITPAQDLELAQAQALVDKLAEYHLNQSIVELIDIASTLKSDDTKYYSGVLRDIGNDRAFFRDVGRNLEALSAHIEGRWLGIIVRDSRIADRSETVDSPTTKDMLSMRLFVRTNDRWSPLLGGSLLEEINSGMEWINRRFISTVSHVIGEEETSDLKALKAILDRTQSGTDEPAVIDAAEAE